MADVTRGSSWAGLGRSGRRPPQHAGATAIALSTADPPAPHSYSTGEHASFHTARAAATSLLRMAYRTPHVTSGPQCPESSALPPGARTVACAGGARARAPPSRRSRAGPGQRRAARCGRKSAHSARTHGS